MEFIGGAGLPQSASVYVLFSAENPQEHMLNRLRNDTILNFSGPRTESGTLRLQARDTQDR